ncbi:MAG: sensor histidine kinase [Ruthenibacterium lactatiformans]
MRSTLIFLLNTVNTIRFMADLARFDSIRDMAADLMEILRCLLRTPAERYTLADEAKILEAYIHIMEVRYSGSFSFRCAFSPESLACRLPKLLLQPLVENALLHGLEGCEDGEVSLSGRTEDGVLYLSVCDNGVGMDPERLAACLSGPGEGKAGSSIGLANVQRRVLLQYGAPYGLWVDSAPGRGTCISITLPAGSGREGGLPCCAQ